MTREAFGFKCETDDGSATMLAVSAEWAADSFAEELALDGELRDGDDVVITVTDPDGVVTKWRCRCTMKPHIETEAEA